MAGRKASEARRKCLPSGAAGHGSGAAATWYTWPCPANRTIWKQLNAALRDAVREQEEREAEPSAAIMDSQAE
jgi:hypothetical protein